MKIGTAFVLGSALLSGIAVRAEPCKPINGLDQVLPAAGRLPRFVVMGERHGTRQSPTLFGDLVCAMSRRSAVNVLLEYTVGSTPDLQTYVASDGSRAARAKFLASDIWDPRYADGRSSVAMFELIEYLRTLRQAGADIQVFATQEDIATTDQFYNELERASIWSRISLDRPKAVNLVLVGAAHAALSDNDHYGFLPAAAHLRPSDVMTIGFTEEGGSQWSLDISPNGKPLMGVHELPGRPVRSAGIFAAPDQSRGWNARYAFGQPAEPSPPAR